MSYYPLIESEKEDITVFLAKKHISKCYKLVMLRHFTIVYKKSDTMQGISIHVVDNDLNDIVESYVNLKNLSDFRILDAKLIAKYGKEA